MIYTFGDYQLDTSLFELRCRGELCPAQPKPLDLLIMLVERRERVVTKDELLRALWPGVVVSDNALAQAIACVRAALREAPAPIASVRGRGYRFLLPVQERSSETVPRAASVVFEVDSRDAALEHLAGLQGAGLTVVTGGDAEALVRAASLSLPAVVFVEHLERVDALTLTLFVALARSRTPSVALVGTCRFDVLEGPARDLVLPLRWEPRLGACG